MALKPPSSGAGEADLEKILAQLLAGASAEEVLEAVPPPVVVPVAPPTAPNAETKSAPNGGVTDWERFSASGASKIPVHTKVRGSVLNARIELLKKPKPAP